jgi:Protein of unknown function (DUF1565)
MIPLTASHIPRRALAALASIALIALVLAAQANAEGKTINVNPRTRNDRGTGSTTSPLRTLAKALSKSRAGGTINLAGGTYSPNSNSEQYSTVNGPQPVALPSGVTIHGNAGGGFQTALSGASNQIGLVLKGNATVSDISLGGFGDAIEASQGDQTLSGIHVGGGGGLRLAGGANTTLSGPVHLTPNFPFSFTNTAFGAFESLTGAAMSVNDQAHTSTTSANVEMTISNVEEGGDGIIAQNLTMRGAKVTQFTTGIRITGGYANLETLPNPWGNRLQGEFNTIPGRARQAVTSRIDDLPDAGSSPT